MATQIVPSNMDASPVTASGQNMVREFDYLLRSGALPQHIKTPHLLYLAYKLLQPLGLDLVVNLRNTWYNPTSKTMDLCNDAPLAACQRRRNEYVGTVEYHVNAKGEKRTQHNFIGFKVEGAVCIAKRSGKEDCIGLFTLEQAKVAGLTGKDNWRKYPEAMLTKRARAIALRLQWSDVLQGVGIYEADDFVAAKPITSGKGVVEAMIGKRRKLESEGELTEVVRMPEPQQHPEDAAESPTGDAARKADQEPASDAEDDLDVIFGHDAEDREPGSDE